MRDEPSGAALLHVARQTLLDDIAPDLTGEARYKALMIANAIGIVAREIGQADRWRQARSRVVGSGDMRNEDDPEATTKRLVAAIRAGDHDADRPLYEALADATEIAAGIWKPAKLPSTSAGAKR